MQLAYHSSDQKSVNVKRSENHEKLEKRLYL